MKPPRRAGATLPVIRAMAGTMRPELLTINPATTATATAVGTGVRLVTAIVITAEVGATLSDLMGEGAFVAKGEERVEVTGFKQAINWLFDQAKRGQSIQRYKGLGEMNADQLWETTMDPDNRVLMQVSIEDAVAADQIFSTLMGDFVEPRREFIEQNALRVSNLDV